METFEALWVDRSADGALSVEVRGLNEEALPPGELLLDVMYSSVNYKDALALIPDGQVVRTYPIVPGVDLAGRVRHSTDSRFREGDEVLVTGRGLGVSRFGGYSRRARVPADWALPLPPGLSAREAMALGTAGLTAGLSVLALQQSGIAPDCGPVIVTGATGGVGSLSVALLAQLGYEVEASTGKAELAEQLRRLGAARVLAREDVAPERVRPLERQRWAGAVDCVGGRTLAAVLSGLQYGGAAAVCGLTGGAELATTMFPFILRGVRMIGIDSVEAPQELRREVWAQLAGPLKPAALEQLIREIALEQVPEAAAELRAGQSTGRLVVALQR